MINKSMIPTAVPNPCRPSLNPTLYKRYTKVSEVNPGPPSVITEIWSNTFNPLIITPSIPNMQLSPSGSPVRKRETPGILSRMFPPVVGITYYRVRAHLAPLIVMSCIIMHMFALYLLFLPPLLSGRPVDRCYPCDGLRRRRSFLFSRASRQAPPLIIPISPIPFSHACIRFCYCYCLLLF